jgi:hypothetical protein
MREGSPKPRPAMEQARRVWKDQTAEVYRTAVRRHGTASAWLKDHGGRRAKGVKAADQLARLSREMSEAGYSLDEIDRALVALVRGIAGQVVGTRPAA